LHLWRRRAQVSVKSDLETNTDAKYGVLEQRVEHSDSNLSANTWAVPRLLLPLHFHRIYQTRFARGRFGRTIFKSEAPRQIVIAGSNEGLNRALESARKSGACKTERLDVAVPSHCLLLEPVADAFEKKFAGNTFATAEDGLRRQRNRKSIAKALSWRS